MRTQQERGEALVRAAVEYPSRRATEKLMWRAAPPLAGPAPGERRGGDEVPGARARQGAGDRLLIPPAPCPATIEVVS